MSRNISTSVSPETKINRLLSTISENNDTIAELQSVIDNATATMARLKIENTDHERAIREIKATQSRAPPVNVDVQPFYPLSNRYPIKDLDESQFAQLYYRNNADLKKLHNQLRGKAQSIWSSDQSDIDRMSEAQDYLMDIFDDPVRSRLLSIYDFDLDEHFIWRTHFHKLFTEHYPPWADVPPSVTSKILRAIIVVNSGISNVLVARLFGFDVPDFSFEPYFAFPPLQKPQTNLQTVTLDTVAALLPIATTLSPPIPSVLDFTPLNITGLRFYFDGSRDSRTVQEILSEVLQYADDSNFFIPMLFPQLYGYLRQTALPDNFGVYYDNCARRRLPPIFRSTWGEFYENND